MAEEKLPVSFDPVRFAKWGRRLEGSIPLSQMSRMTEQVTELRGEVSVALDCSMGEDRVRALRGHITAVVPMQCQRCMDEVEIQVDSQFSLGVVDSEAFAEKLPEEYEPLFIEEGEKLFLKELIEDELILALPIVPMHPQEECKAGGMSEDDMNLVQEESPQESPFAILKDLKI
ncbi:MAG: YceD family protein [Gammaproteobacteria bacterium]|nr:YceD family protein [Gammaproteobacteria bacterium]